MIVTHQVSYKKNPISEVRVMIEKINKLEQIASNAKKEAEKSDRLSNFSIGFSLFVLFFKIFVELVIKK